MTQELFLADWNAREAIAEAMVPLVGRLYRDRNVEISIYGRLIVKRSVINILKAHRFVRQVEDEELSVVDTFPVLEAVSEMAVSNAHVDIGKLAVKFRNQGNGARSRRFSTRSWPVPRVRWTTAPPPMWCSMALAASVVCWHG